MYETLTPEAIKADMLGRISAAVDTREGSFAGDMVSAVAYELWKAYQSLNAVIPIAFVNESSGGYIDKRCAEYGITRKPGARARVRLIISGTDGTAIPAGKVFLTVDGLQFETEAAAVVMGGSAAVTAIAAEIGEAYNVDAGAVTMQLTNLSGIASVTSEAAAGGADAEGDAALVGRLYDYLRNTATSGNAAHYRQWVLSVNGVGAAKVTPLWDGPGTVKVLIVGGDRGPVDPAIVDSCAAYIEENRPVGASVTVMSAQGLEVHVQAAVTLDGTAELSDVKAAFAASLEEYLKGIAFERYTLLYNRIAYMLLDIPGVADYTALTVNGGAENIGIGEDQVPVLGAVEVSAP